MISGFYYNFISIRILKLMPVLLFLITTSCTDEMVTLDNKRQLSLQVAVKDGNSRAMLSGQFLPEGAQIGVRVVDFNLASYDASVYNNVLYTAKGSDITQSWDSETKIMLSKTPAFVYAYYPYKENVDITYMPIETASQTDYMYATPLEAINYDNNSITLQMNHVLSAVKISLLYKGKLDEPKLSSISMNSEAIATNAYMYKDGSLSDITGMNSVFSTSFELVYRKILLLLLLSMVMNIK